MSAFDHRDGPTFVGADRRALVAGFISLLDHVEHSSSPRWISLEAPSGWGKTRIAHEIYRELAARQPQPPYWPSAMIGASGGGDVSARRKKVNPDVAHVPGSLPSFLWWGISCSSRNGVPSVALAQDLALFEAHAPYLDDAWLRLPGTARWRGDLRDFAGAALDEGLMEVGGTVVEAALGAAVPGLGLVRWVGEWAWGKNRDRITRNDRLESNASITPSHEDIGDELVSVLTRLARGGLPVVLFVEDLHEADDLLLDVLVRLTASPAAILIITTAWPGHVDEREEMREAFAAAGDRLVRISSEEERTLPHPFPREAGLEPLASADLSSLLHHYYPRVEARTEALVVARYPNPLALELFCSIDRVRRRFADRELRLTAGDIEHLPSSLRELYRQHWAELPERVRHALALATFSIPAVLEPETGRSPLWNHDVIVDALRELDLPDREEVANSLDNASTAYAWARAVTDTLRRFNEPDQLAVAVDDQSTYLFEDEVRTLKNLLAIRVADRIERMQAATEQEHAARLLLALHAEGFVDDPHVLGTASLMLLRLLRDDERELLERVRIAERALGSIDPRSESGFELRAQLGNAQRLLERSDDAISTLTMLVADLEGVRGMRHPDVLTARWEALASLDESTLAERIVDVQSLREDVSATDEAEPLLRARAGNLLGSALSASGRVVESIDAYRAAHAAAVDALGSEHRHTLLLLDNLAQEMSVSGDYVRANAVRDDVLRRRWNALGAVHRDTIASRCDAAERLVDQGLATDALAAMTSAVHDSQAALGPFHPQTLLIVSAHARILDRVARFSDAVAVRERLAADTAVAKGAMHAATFLARVALASAYGRAMRTQDAVRALDDVIADAGEAHGDRAAVVFAARSARALLIKKIKGPAAIVDELISIAADAQSAFDLRDAVVIDATENLIRTLSDLGRYDAVVVIVERTIGALNARPHPDYWLIGSFSLTYSYALRQSGEPERALEVIEAAHARAAERYGSASGVAVSTMNELLAVLLTLHRFADVAALAPARIDAIRAGQGEADVWAIMMQLTLGDALIGDGRLDDGLDELRAASEVAVKAVGDSHETTIEARRRLRNALSEAGRTGEEFTVAMAGVDAIGEVHGRESVAYRDALVSIGDTVLGSEGDVATARPYLDELVESMQRDPDAAQDELLMVRLQRAYTMLFALDPACVAELHDVHAAMTRSWGPDDARTESAATLQEIARRGFADPD